jgi:hypothetical protein
VLRTTLCNATARRSLARLYNHIPTERLIGHVERGTARSRRQSKRVINLVEQPIACQHLRAINLFTTSELLSYVSLARDPDNRIGGDNKRPDFGRDS